MLRHSHQSSPARGRLRRALRAVGIGIPVALSAVVAACSPTAALRDLRDMPRTDHERYARSLRDAGLDSTAIGRDWLGASDSALRAPLTLALPARELGTYQRNEARAVAYRFALRDGERLRVTLRADGLPARLYLDLFEVTPDTAQAPVHRASGARVTAARDSAARDTAVLVALTHEATANATYLLRLQPELLRSGRFELLVQTEPTLAFPVEGRGNGAIQSLFGVDRDGGRRAHHGIDIFAPRGTPVLAATDGTVRSISPNELGGNVVWLSDTERGQTLYYAHLDRQIVTAGQSVERGDTLGFVGNTGNARTTAPHLHFGIYRRPEGPIDPLRFVRINNATPAALTADTSYLGRFALTRSAAPSLRAAPADTSVVTRRLQGPTRVQIMGANANMFRVQLEDGSTGYLSNASVRVIGR